MNGEQTPMWAHKHVRNAVIAALLVLAVFLAVQTANSMKRFSVIGKDIPTQSTISVQGQGEVFAVPDIAMFTFSVVEEKTTVNEAQTVATEKGNQAIAYLEDNGIEDKDIKTVNYSVQPQYDYIRQECREGFCPPGERQLRGFEVRQTVQVKVRDTESAGNLLSGLGEIGVSQVSGLNFTIDDDEQLKQDAREQAIADAKEKAQTLAQDLDVDLVRIINFHESGNVPMRERYDDAALGMGGDGAAEQSAPALPTGENKITSNVSITYEIR